MPEVQTAPIARTFVAIGMAAFGIHQLAYGSFARWVAKAPALVPAPAIWPYLTGAAFVAGIEPGQRLGGPAGYVGLIGGLPGIALRDWWENA